MELKPHPTDVRIALHTHSQEMNKAVGMTSQTFLPLILHILLIKRTSVFRT